LGQVLRDGLEHQCLGLDLGGPVLFNIAGGLRSVWSAVIGHSVVVVAADASIDLSRGRFPIPNALLNAADATANVGDLADRTSTGRRPPAIRARSRGHLPTTEGRIQP